MGKFDNNQNLIDIIKDTPVEDLHIIADQLRQELLEDVSQTGGHLASNLGIVELTVALHKVFNSPQDKIVWDVGHQCYVHKMITGRRDEMSGLRQLGGISGFPKRAESVHDTDDPGHSGTSVSVALGYALARDLNGEDYSCVAVMGDGALTSGVAYEALNHAGSTNTPLIVILNDNQMSIGKSVGGTSRTLNKLRTSKFYNTVKKALKTTKNIPWLYNFLKSCRNFLKSILMKDQIFDDLGFKYYGPIDGHDIPELCSELEFAKHAKCPVLLHVMTVKGKGYEPAENNPSLYHGVGSFDLKQGISENKKPTWSDIFGDELCKLAEEDKRITAISAAMVDATGLGEFAEKYPDRLFDVGIAEQHAVSLAEGLALSGKRPVVAIYSTFLQRAYDEILTEICLQDLPVVFAIDRAGITGADGETHQGMFDLAYLNSMPNMHVLNAYDEPSFRAMIKYAVTLGHPCAIRYGKTDVVPGIAIQKDYKPSIKYYKDGFEVLFITDGNMMQETIVAASKLNMSTCVCTMEQLKPLDIQFIASACKKYKYIITVEDGCYTGGYGSSISQIAATLGEAEVLNISWPDKFIEHGTIKELRAKYGMNHEGILKKTEAFIESQA